MLAQQCLTAVERLARQCSALVARDACALVQLRETHSSASVPQSVPPATALPAPVSPLPTPARFVNTRANEENLDPPRIQWVFLGAPGVGKGTYSTRVAVALGVAHIAAGDLVRWEMRSGSKLGKSVRFYVIVHRPRAAIQMEAIVNKGNLLPDEMITEILNRRIERGKDANEKGFVLDGFPRSVQQAQELLQEHDIQLAVNLQLRKEVLIEKCMGRRICRKCGKGWNVADIYLPAEGDTPEISMPPLDPPHDCRPFMQQREDDKEEVIRTRLDTYNQYAKPVESFFDKQGKLKNFEITGGIPETLPLLYSALKPHCGNWHMADFEEGQGTTMPMAAVG